MMSSYTVDRCTVSPSSPRFIGCWFTWRYRFSMWQIGQWNWGIKFQLNNQHPWRRTRSIHSEITPPTEAQTLPTTHYRPPVHQSNSTNTHRCPICPSYGIRTSAYSLSTFTCLDPDQGSSQTHQSGCQGQPGQSAHHGGKREHDLISSCVSSGKNLILRQAAISRKTATSVDAIFSAPSNSGWTWENMIRAWVTNRPLYFGCCAERPLLFMFCKPHCQKKSHLFGQMGMSTDDCLSPPLDYRRSITLHSKLCTLCKNHYTTINKSYQTRP